MELSSMLSAVLIGGLGLLTISLMFWSGQALLNLLEQDDLAGEHGLIQGRADRAPNGRPVDLSVRDGQERLATQPERDDVNGRIERGLPLPANRAG